MQLASLTTGVLGEAIPRIPAARLARRLVSVAGHGPPARGRRPRDDHAGRHAQALLAADGEHRQAGLPAGPGHPHARPGACGAPDLKPVAGQLMAFSVTDPRGNVVFREGKSHQPIRDRLGRLPAGRAS